MKSTKLINIYTLLEDSGTTIKCSELRAHLEEIGSKVRDGKRAGHKIVTHSGLKDFYSTSYNCGHGKNPEIRPGYIKNILKTIKFHEKALSDYLNEEG